MKPTRILASALVFAGAVFIRAQTPAPAGNSPTPRGSALPPEVEAAIKAQADALKSQPLGAAAAAAMRASGPAPIASAKLGENLTISVLNLSENRNSSGTGGGNINLGVSGEGLPPGSMVRQILVSKTTDDSGRAIVLAPARGGITVLGSSMLTASSRLTNALRGAAPMASNSVQIGLAPREAKAIGALEGQVEIYTPSEKNGSMVILKNIRARAGKPLDDEVLAKNGIEIVPLTPEQIPEYQARVGTPGGAAQVNANGIPFYIHDAQNKLVGFVFLGLDGMPLPIGQLSPIINGRGDGGGLYNAMAAGRGGPVPDEIQIAIFLATPDSTRTLPFRIENIPLP